jgi:hypothetical protein
MIFNTISTPLKSIAIPLLLLYGISCCQKQSDDPNRVGVVGPNVYVLGAGYQSHQSNTMKIYVDVGIIDEDMYYSQDATDTSEYPPTLFQNYTSNGVNFLVDSVRIVSTQQNDPYSNLLLVDRSADGLPVIDPEWSLLSGIHYSCKQTLEGGNEMAVGHYSEEGGIYMDAPSGRNPFSLTLNELVPFYRSYHTPTGNIRNPIDALVKCLNEYDIYSTHPNKNITLVTCTSQGTNQQSIAQAVALAKAKNVKINVIFLKLSSANNTTPLELYYLAGQTGGFVSIILKDDYWLPKMALGIISSTHRFIAHNTRTYRIYGRMVRSSVWSPGTFVKFLYRIGSVPFYIPIYVAVP